MVQILAQLLFWGDMDMFFFMSRRVVSPFVLSSSESTVLMCFNHQPQPLLPGLPRVATNGAARVGRTLAGWTGR